MTETTETRFHFLYYDDHRHTATFENLPRAREHFMLRSGLLNGPDYCLIFDTDTGEKVYEKDLSEPIND